MIYIYTLTDPITNEIKYCGKTNNLKIRLSGHMKEKKVIEKYNWIKNLKLKGLKPLLEVIDEVDDNNWDFWEKYWISQLKTWGFDLLNKTNGGEYSVTGFHHTDEAKRKISNSQIGKKLSEEWRQNISIGRKCIKFSDEHRKNISNGVKNIMTIEYRKKMSDTMKLIYADENKNVNLSQNRIPIYQIDIHNGEILNKFNSITARGRKI